VTDEQDSSVLDLRQSLPERKFVEPVVGHRHFSVSAFGVRSPVITAGPDDASEAVVFVHGNPGAGREWEHLLGRVGDFARAVAPDMPGYAGADKPRTFEYTVDGYAHHLAGLLNELSIDRAHLVMHDFGGPWALQWAISHPDSFASATMINSGVWVDYRHYHFYGRVWRTPVLGELFMATASRLINVWWLQRENPGLSGEQANRLYDQLRPWATKRAILRLYRATPPASLGSRSGPLRKLDRPALVVWGAADAYIPREMADRQRRSFPCARIEVLEGLGHWCFLEDPERVASLVVPFLRDQIGRRRPVSTD
jgi:pimeloyl-ACP methyl ester carboxylesterase